MNTKQIAQYVMAIHDLSAWLADESGKDAAVIMAMRDGDTDARHMFRCVMENDSTALHHAAEKYAD